jgi:hypothetical protein
MTSESADRCAEILLTQRSGLVAVILTGTDNSRQALTIASGARLTSRCEAEIELTLDCAQNAFEFARSDVRAERTSHRRHDDVSRGGDLAPNGHLMNAVGRSQLIEGDAIDEVPTKKRPLLVRQVDDGTVDGVLKRSSIPPLYVCRVSSRAGRHEIFGDRASGAIRYASQIEGYAHGHYANPAAQRTVALIIDNSRTLIGFADEQTRSKDLHHLVREITVRTYVVHEARNTRQVLMLENVERRCRAFCTSARQVEILRARSVDPHLALCTCRNTFAETRFDLGRTRDRRPSCAGDGEQLADVRFTRHASTIPCRFDIIRAGALRSHRRRGGLNVLPDG